MELVRRARQGDRSAYDGLVQRYQGIARRVAFLECGSGADADDAVQEGFVKAWNALDGFREEAPFRPWLLRIVANEARNRRRSASRRERLALRVAEGRPSGDEAPSPEEAVLSGERRQALLAAVDSLGDQDRAVIGCRYLLGLSEAESAAALGCPPGTVKSRLSRALGRLRELLEQEPEVADR